jgi:hypothetical protein
VVTFTSFAHCFIVATFINLHNALKAFAFAGGESQNHVRTMGKVEPVKARDGQSLSCISDSVEIRRFRRGEPSATLATSLGERKMWWDDDV